MMKIQKATHHLGIALLLAGSGMMGCTADYAYKTSQTGEEEMLVETYEGTFFAEAEANSIISVDIRDMEAFDAVNFRAELDQKLEPQYFEESEPMMEEDGEEADQDNGEGQQQFPESEIRSGKVLVGDSQNRTLNNPWVTLDENISYRIFYHVSEDKLFMKAFYIDKSDPNFPEAGKIVSQKTAEERNVKPIWQKMVSFAEQHGTNLTVQ